MLSMQMEKESMQNRKPMILVFSRTKWLREKYNNNFFDKVVERYYKSINNIKELLNICDIMHVYDNTKTPERIIRKHKDELSIYLNEYWTEQDILGLME